MSAPVLFMVPTVPGFMLWWCRLCLVLCYNGVDRARNLCCGGAVCRTEFVLWWCRP